MNERNGDGPDVNVTDIGDYVDKNCCGRDLKLRLMIRKDPGALDRMFPHRHTIRGTLDPVLATSGRLREEETEAALSQRMRCLNPSKEDEENNIRWSSLMSSLRTLEDGEEIFAREVEIGRRIGRYLVAGRMDFVILTWKDGRPVLRIAECKASRKDKTYHRIQLAAYRLMVEEELLETSPVIAGKVREVVLETAVVRIDKDSRRTQDVLNVPSLPLREEMDDIRRLLAPGGPVETIDDSPLDELSYCLEEKCDTCMHDTICMPESERQARLELLGLDPVTVRALRKEGVADLLALSELDLSSPQASAVRNTPAFGADLDDLVRRAKARRSTLPQRRRDDYQVINLGHHGVSLLPAHQNDVGFRTIRVYLDVEYDHVEDRLVGLCAHLTDSERVISTVMDGEEPYPRPMEESEEAAEPMQGVYVLRINEHGWSGAVEDDDLAEGEMVASFFDGLGRAIAAIAGKDEFRPVHFYLWSSKEMTYLIESCSRAGGPLLRSLTELLGCREKCRGDLEQLIFTSISDEISRSKALGYTSFSLPLAASVRWYGRSFHWYREVDGEPVNLAYAFKRDLFDNRAALYLTEDGEWAPKGRNTPDAQRRYMEVHARFRSGIPVPYWHAMWGTLPDRGEWKDKMGPGRLPARRHSRPDPGVPHGQVRGAEVAGGALRGQEQPAGEAHGASV